MYKVAAVNIDRVSYCPIRKLLEVQFLEQPNITYQYQDVPEEVWYGLKNAVSMDLFFNRKVATCYRMKCIRKQKKNNQKISL